MKTEWCPKGIGNFLLFIVFLPLLLFSSCVYDREFTYLNDEVNALNRRVTQLQETVGGSLARDIDGKLEQFRSNQKEMRLELDELKGEIQGLSGRTEDNENILKRTVEKDLGQQEMIRTTLEDLSRRVATLEIAVNRQREFLGLEIPKQEEGIGSEKEGPESLKPPPESGGLPIEQESEELALYDKALGFYREGRFEEAMEGFTGFLKKYPKSDRLDNAQFWIGECQMALKQYEQAILSFQKVIKEYPKGNKVPSALLRQSQAFWEINDKTSAKLLLKKIIKNYPKTNEAGIAQKKLDTMK